MIALDTNVLVRFITRDEVNQAEVVYALFRQAEAAHERFFVPLLVVMETIWVLRSTYGRSREDVLDAIERIRQMSILEFEANPLLQQFLALARKSSADLPDLLIALSAEASGCESGLTFDKNASKIAFFHLLK